MTTSIEPRLVGEGTQWTLILERSLNHSPEKVWEALIEPDHLVNWAPFLPDRALTSVGPMKLTMLGVNESSVLDSQIQEIEPPKLLVFNWGEDILRWELSGESTTRLVLKHRFAELKEAPSYAAGWHLCLDALGSALRGEVKPSVVGDAALDHGWQELYEHYSRQLVNNVDSKR